MAHPGTEGRVPRCCCGNGVVSLRTAKVLCLISLLIIHQREKNGQSALCESNLPPVLKKAGDEPGLEQCIGKDERDLSEVISLHSPFYEFIFSP